MPRASPLPEQLGTDHVAASMLPAPGRKIVRTLAVGCLCAACKQHSLRPHVWGLSSTGPSSRPSTRPRGRYQGRPNTTCNLQLNPPACCPRTISARLLLLTWEIRCQSTQTFVIAAEHGLGASDQDSRLHLATRPRVAIGPKIDSWSRISLLSRLIGRAGDIQCLKTCKEADVAGASVRRGADPWPVHLFLPALCHFWTRKTGKAMLQKATVF